MSYIILKYVSSAISANNCTGTDIQLLKWKSERVNMSSCYCTFVV